jgi:hypothetical protein
MRRFITLVACIGGLTAAAAPTATAQLAPPHQHFLTPPGGERHLVGPRVCENPANLTGFSGFHFNVHFGMPSEVFGPNPITFTAPVPCPP